MFINWEGIKMLLGWKGSVEDLKRSKLPDVQQMPEKHDDELAIRNVPLSLSGSDENPYRLRVQVGDRVYLPNGKDKGTVYMVEKMYSCYFIISVRSDKKRRWFGLRAAIPLRFACNEIDQLQLIATEKEMEAITTELDEELDL